MINYKSYSDETHEFVDASDEMFYDQPNKTIMENAEEVDSLDDSLIGVVNTREVYIRSRASRDSDPVTTVKEGSELMILDLGYPDWYQVMTASGVEGYIMSEFVDLQ